jgi:hypothetical protein
MKGQIMAKDKSKKKGPTSDEFGKPSEAPAGGDGFKLTTDENVGKLFLITPLRAEEKPAFGKAGEKGERQEVIIADVVAINEKNPAKSEEHEDVWVFGGWLKGALRGFIGERRVVCRLVQAKDKQSATGYVWKFEDGTEKDIEKVREYLASLDPFKTKGGKSADEKPSKKGKAKAEPEPKSKKKSKK